MDVFPDGGREGQSMDRRLRELGRTVSPTQIAELWVFPPLSTLQGSSEFFLFTRFEGDRRRLYSAFLPPGASVNGTSGQRITEHGVVPADRVPRMVAQLQRRLGEPAQPLHVEIAGSEERWAQITSA
ncbi:MAG: hypothetical protein JSV95_02960 [Gemmatimonadota bacterium]|jgi:hypothetical protein|nr:MAG: hypothetical protein JSV95_02960 [Gemmatimonadota bacterium]